MNWMELKEKKQWIVQLNAWSITFSWLKCSQNDFNKKIVLPLYFYFSFVQPKVYTDMLAMVQGSVANFIVPGFCFSPSFLTAVHILHASNHSEWCVCLLILNKHWRYLASGPLTSILAFHYQILIPAWQSGSVCRDGRNFFSLMLFIITNCKIKLFFW